MQPDEGPMTALFVSSSVHPVKQSNPKVNKAMSDYVLWLHELGMNDVEIVGGKNASLGEMIQNLTDLGVQVPGGFATTAHAYREFLTYSSIFRRSFGLPGTVKRLAYNIRWMKVDPLWEVIVRLGLMPYATRIFNRVLRVSTKNVEYVLRHKGSKRLSLEPGEYILRNN